MGGISLFGLPFTYGPLLSLTPMTSNLQPCEPIKYWQQAAMWVSNTKFTIVPFNTDLFLP